MSGDRTFADRTFADATTPASDLMRPGLRVGGDGRYELLSKLGEGGMGSVWRAKDLKLKREVAIKRIRGATSPVLQERFLRETRALTGLSHPNVVTVFDAGEDAYGNYLVMELVSGKTLAQRLKEGPIDPSQSVDLFCAMCRGMSHAHKRGVIHRDLKPSNVMLNDDGVARILDFGLVRLEGSGDLSLTGVGMGTLDYASPEQKQDGGAADERSDVFALGLVFYEMLTGKRPAPLQVHKVSQPWRDVIAKATEPEPQERHASMDELLGETEEARSAVSHEAAITQAMGKDDDLRCPKCRLVNTLEAKFCRSCGESLRTSCPACKASIRTGLKLCDQCSADVGLVHQMYEAVDAANRLAEGGKLAEAASSVHAIHARMASGRMGADSKLKPATQAVMDRVAQSSKQGRELVEQAVAHEQEDKFEDALAAWQRAAATDESLSEDAAEFAAKAPRLIRERDRASGMAMTALQQVSELVAKGCLSSALTTIASLQATLGTKAKQWWVEIEQRVTSARLQIGYQRARAKAVADSASAQWERLEFEVALKLHREALSMDDGLADRVQAAEAQAAAAMVIRDRARASVEEARVAALDAQQRLDVAGMEDALAKATQQLAAAGPSFAAAQAWMEEVRLACAREKEEVQLACARENELRAAIARGKRRRTVVLALAVLACVGAVYGWSALRSARIASALAIVDQETSGPLATLKALAADRLFPLHADFQQRSVQASHLAQVWRESVSAERDAVADRQSFENIVQSCRDQCVAAVKGIDAYGAEANQKSEAIQEALTALGAPGSEIAAIAKYWSVRNAEWSAMESDSEVWSARIRALEAVQEDTLRTAAIAARSALASAVDDWKRAIQRGGGAPECRLAARRVYSQLMWEAAQTESRVNAAWGSVTLEGLRDGFAAAPEWAIWCERAVGWNLAPDLIAAIRRSLNPSSSMAEVGSSMGIELEPGSSAIRDQLVHRRSGIQLVAIQPGSFDMGSVSGDADEKPVHRVSITRPFWMGKTEVTQAQYRAIVGRNPSRFADGADADRRPVENVSWSDAVAFCEAMSKATVSFDGVKYGFRLPTEAEWEYCCRAGTTTDWHVGSGLSSRDANFADSKHERTVAVGSYAGNAWGLYDMHGNVWEWCLDSGDRSANYPSSAVSDPYVSSGPIRVFRGGSWHSAADVCRSAVRDYGNPGSAGNDVGFRVVLAPVLVK
jgi:formylglycine-generating enzyme required for sulfatase activity